MISACLLQPDMYIGDHDVSSSCPSGAASLTPLRVCGKADFGASSFFH